MDKAMDVARADGNVAQVVANRLRFIVDVVLRILDANLNRVREGLRVLEDTARFGCNDAAISRELKGLRHELSEVVAMLSVTPSELLDARDTTGDVGTAISTTGEQRRQDLDAIVHAAAGRLAEALRSIEECCKAMGKIDAAKRVEAMRYASYTLHQRLAGRLERNATQYALCVLITERLCSQPWQAVAEAAVAGGADCLQLREKELADAELLRRAQWLVSLAGSRAAVFVNDRVDIAMLACASGVHLGQTDLPVRDARKLAGSRLLVGVSTENIAQARQAVADGADLCGVGPMFATTTKDKPRLAGPAYLREYLRDEMTGNVPYLAIGGISPMNVVELVASGCRGIAVSSVVCNASNPRKICEELRTCMQAGATKVQ